MRQRTEGKPRQPPGCSSSSSRRRAANGMMTVAATTALCLLSSLPVILAFAPNTIITSSSQPHSNSNTCLFSSDWSDFSYIDDDDDLLDGDGDSMKAIDFADENDPQELKAQVGSSLEAPEVDWDGDPLEVPLGELCFRLMRDGSRQSSSLYVCVPIKHIYLYTHRRSIATSFTSPRHLNSIYPTKPCQAPLSRSSPRPSRASWRRAGTRSGPCSDIPPRTAGLGSPAGWTLSSWTAPSWSLASRADFGISDRRCSLGSRRICRDGVRKSLMWWWRMSGSSQTRPTMRPRKKRDGG